MQLTVFKHNSDRIPKLEELQIWESVKIKDFLQTDWQTDNQTFFTQLNSTKNIQTNYQQPKPNLSLI